MSYICIHCGHSVRELYKRYSLSVLKITNCHNCHKIADKYIEFEPIIIVIDLILLARPAYRHVLYNTQFQIHWKLNLIILLLDAYISWSNKSHLFARNDGIFTKEKLFYFCFGLAIIDNVIGLILLRLTLFVAGINNGLNLNALLTTQTPTESSLIVLLVKSMSLANIAKFFLLPIVIWNNHQSEFGVKLNFILVMGYFLYGMVHVHSVVSGLQRLYSALLVILCLIIKGIVFNIIANQLEKVFLF